MKDQNLIAFGERIKNIRKALGLSQKDFAGSINVPNSSLSEIEAGQTRPTFYFFFNMSETHNVNLEYLFFGKGDMFKNGTGSKKIDGVFMDEDIKEMIENLQISAVKLSMMAEYNRVKKIFKPLIDEFHNTKVNIKESLG